MGRRVADPGVENSVRRARAARGWSQQELAARVGLTRQAVSAIESGSYIPNTLVGLRLARELECPVEELFHIPTAVDVPSVEIASPLEPNVRRIALANVAGRWIGHPLSEGRELQQGFVSADALVMDDARSGRAQLLRPVAELEKTALLMGCDPSLGILGAHIERHSSQGRLLWLSCASQTALDAVARGEAHVAGSHLHDPDIDDYNLIEARRALSPTGGLLVAFARWELGFVVAPGNRKRIRSVADLADRNVRLVNREPGAGSRALLDEHLARAGVPSTAVHGYERVVYSHMAAGVAVASGGADVAVALRATATSLGLAFVPIAEVRFDLVIPRPHLAH
ncbi:MAG TPA: substrate-binding domain-containing protein, partial [Chloroflexota bacterium]|nr:substrate-binding domain-containing protein [Chloroflexota bacterium]